MKRASPSEEASFSHPVTAGVRGVGGEVKRKAVDQGYLEGWLAGWLWLWWAADKLAAPPDGNLTKPRNGGERGRFLLAAAARLTNVLTVATPTLTDTVMRSWGCERE